METGGRGPKNRATNKPRSRSMLVTAGVTFQLSSERNVGSREEAMFLSLSHYLPTGREKISLRGQRAPTQEPRIFCPGIPYLRQVLRSIVYGCGSTWFFGAGFCFWDILILSSLTSASALLPRFSNPRGEGFRSYCVPRGPRAPTQNRAPFFHVLQILVQGIIWYQLFTCVFLATS